MSLAQPKAYKRIFLKLSGQSLGNFDPTLNQQNQSFFSPSAIDSTTKLIEKTFNQGIEIAIMTGGGNIVRGRDLDSIDLSIPAKDNIGMLATIMNSIVLYEALQNLKLPVVVLSSLSCQGVFESFSYQKARHYLEQKKILILAGGSGKPVFTTDTASVVLAVQTACESIFKLTKVDGLYSKDPSQKDAQFYSAMPFSEVIKQKLEVMDLTAFTLCQKYKIPIHICNMHNSNAIIENSGQYHSGSYIFPD